MAFNRAQAGTITVDGRDLGELRVGEYRTLDEATSSLDSESEGLIQDGLRRLRHGRTSFVIAHRLSTIKSADQILVIEGGEIVESGTHPQLMASCGRYRHLHDRQYAWEGERFVNEGEELSLTT